MRTGSHANILKSTSLIGGASAITLLIRMVRTKVLAVLLGPAGVGLEALYDSIIQIAQTISGLGVKSSGVRQIAAAVASEDQQRIGRTVWILRRTALFLGCTGALLLFLFRKPISIATFGSDQHSGAVGALSVILLLAAVNGGQGALLQGMRRIGDLAKMQIFGAVCGTIFAIPIVYIWGSSGIPAYLILGAATGTLLSWIYARRIRVERMPVPASAARKEVRELLHLGIVFLSSAVMSLGALYVLRVAVSRNLGIEAVGLFQAASTLSMVYVGFILQAMGSDFYPRLTAVAHNNEECNRLVNEQTEVSLLLAVPGLVTTIAMAPWVLQLFYSAKFATATTLLCLQTAGMLLRIFAWPMGFILVAKGKGKIFFCTELFSWSAYVLFAWAGMRWLGLTGAGVAFTAMYGCCAVLIFFVVRQVSGFGWSHQNLRIFTSGTVFVGGALASHFFLPPKYATAIGVFLALWAGLFSFRILLRLVGTQKVNSYLRKLKLPVAVPRWLRRWSGETSCDHSPLT